MVGKKCRICSIWRGERLVKRKENVTVIGSGSKIMVDLYFLLYAFLNFLKSSTRPNIIWVIKHNDTSKEKEKNAYPHRRENSWRNGSHFQISED